MKSNGPIAKMKQARKWGKSETMSQSVNDGLIGNF